MGKLIDACFRMIVFALLLCVGVAAVWYFASDWKHGGPRLRVVTTRPLPADTKLTAKDVALELAWHPKDAPRIGQATQVIGAKLISDIKVPRPLIWNDLKIEPVKEEHAEEAEGASSKDKKKK